MLFKSSMSSSDTVMGIFLCETQKALFQKLESSARRSNLRYHSHVLDMKVVPKCWQLNYVASRDDLWRRQSQR